MESKILPEQKIDIENIITSKIGKITIIDFIEKELKERENLFNNAIVTAKAPDKKKSSKESFTTMQLKDI